LNTLTIHSFYVISWPGGQPLYNRRWLEAANHPALLSGLMTGLELMALNLTSQHVNVVTMKENRFFFQIDEGNGVLCVFITDLAEGTETLQEYLNILNRRFIELFGSQKGKEVIMPNLQKVRAFDRVVDDLVANWEAAEVGLVDVKIVDVLDVFTHFFNTILQKLLTEDNRSTHWTKIQEIFHSNIRNSPALTKLVVDSRGFVNYDKIDFVKIEYDQMVKILCKTLKELLFFVQEIISSQEYHTLFYDNILPLIKFEMKRLLEYQLVASLVVGIL